MPAADILVVLCHSLASPKSVIFKVFLPMSSFSIFSSNKTGRRGEGGALEEGGGETRRQTPQNRGVKEKGRKKERLKVKRRADTGEGQRRPAAQLLLGKADSGTKRLSWGPEDIKGKRKAPPPPVSRHLSPPEAHGRAHPPPTGPRAALGKRRAGLSLPALQPR